MQGKLFPPQLEQCESHVKDCQQCHETLVELSANDTLSDRIFEALKPETTDALGEETPAAEKDSVEIQNLLHRLNSDDFKLDAMRFRQSRGNDQEMVNPEIIADRAAEVLRCLTPEAESLGVLGDYTLVRLIGAGSTGVVFQAVDQKLDRTVALKVLRPSLGETARERFLAEAKSAASIEHVNVVTIFEVGKVGRLAYMAMPWLPGQTLESLLASAEQLSADQIVKITTQVAAGLSAAHQNNLVHRDIKPANLWICEDDFRLKILDFGLARISDDDPNLTATGMLAGTPSFMSPEQTRGLELDGRSDLFSLGCVLYRLLTGKLPFGAPTVLAVLSSIQSHHPTPPVGLKSDVSQNLSDLTMCLLEKQPADRPQSALQTIELLQTPREQWSLAVQNYAATPAQNIAVNNRPAASPKSASSGRGWSSWFLAAIGLAMLGTIGWWFAPQIIRVATDQGEVVIETNDDNVEVQVLQDGKIVRVVDTQTHQSFALKSGQYSFNAVPTEQEDGETNTFSISPNALTVRRGDSAILSVTLVTKEAASVASEERETSIKVPVRALYKGKPFQHWIETARFDNHIPTITQAMVACAKIKETKEEQDQLLALTCKLARHHGSNVVGASPDSDLYHESFMAVLDHCDDDEILEFIRKELNAGTVQSRKFIYAWMFHVSGRNSGISNEDLAQRNRVRMRTAELSEAFSKNLDAPFVTQLAEAMLDRGALETAEEDSEKLLRQIRDSSLGAAIKESVKTVGLTKRYELAKLALEVFPDDSQIFKIYRKDLFDSKLDDTTIKSEGFSLGLFPNTEIPWPVARVNLLKSILQALAPSEWSGKRPKLDPKTEARRFAAAADLLAEVVDGFLSDMPQGIEITAEGEAIVSPGKSEIEGLKEEVRISVDPSTSDFSLAGTPEDTALVQKAFEDWTSTRNLLQQILNPNREQNLLLQQVSQNGRFGGGGGGFGFSTQQSFEPLPPDRLCRNVLQTIHTIGQRSSDEKVKQSLIKTLTRLEAALGPDETFTENAFLGGIPGAPLREDIKYVLANLRGTPINAPANTRLRNDQQSNNALPENAPVAPGIPIANAKTAESDIKPKDQTVSATKPFFKGQTFNRWFHTAFYDRDLRSRADAMDGCAATAETEQEWEQLIGLTRDLARQYGSRVSGLNRETDYLEDAMVKVLNKAGVDRTLEFFKTEIAQGNASSLAFCEKWFYTTTDGSLEVPGIRHEHEMRDTVANRTVELLDDMNINMESPGVLDLLGALIRWRGQKKEILNPIRNSSFGAKLKKLLINGDLQQQIRLRTVALPILKEDQQIMDLYVSTLVNPELNEGTFELPEGSHIHGSWARYLLLNSFSHFVFPSDWETEQSEKKSDSDSPNINHAVEALTRVLDGIFVSGKQKLKFSDSQAYSPFHPMQVMTDRELVRILLRHLYHVSHQVREDENKRRLIESIEKIRQWLSSQDWSPTIDGEFDKQLITLGKDTEYLMALLKGKELPERHQPSSLWNANSGGGFGGGVF